MEVISVLRIEMFLAEVNINLCEKHAIFAFQAL